MFFRPVLLLTLVINYCIIIYMTTADALRLAIETLQKISDENKQGSSQEDYAISRLRNLLLAIL